MKIRQTSSGRSCLRHLLALLATLAFAQISQAATYYVTTTGNDSNSGTSEALAFRTVGKAMSKGANTINVKSGVYNESTTAAVYGINLVGYGPTKPIMDGQGSRGVAFTNCPMSIQNFEIRNYTAYGICTGNGNSSTEIKNCVIHDIGCSAQTYARGIWLNYSNGSKITNNVIYMIGPGSESMGIFVYTCTNVIVDGNVTYLCRKNGIRDGGSNGCIIKNNRSYLNWSGIDVNSSINALVVNNYMHNNTIGFNPKHGGGTSQWNCFWHNTIYKSSLASVICGGDQPPINYIDIRDNIYDNASLTFFQDHTGAATFATIDYNDYFRRPNNYPTYFYTYDWSHTIALATMTAFQAYKPAWEDHGMTFDPQLIDPDSGNLDYPAGSPAAAGGVMLPDALGKQLGARGLPPAALKWVPITMTAIATNMSGGFGNMANSCDGRQTTYFSGSSPSNQYIVYDFGSVKTLSHLRLSSLIHLDTRNVKAYSFQTSQTNNGTDWVTVKSGTNCDSSFATYEYALATPTSARYLKFNMLSNFGGAACMISDVEVGNLTANGGGGGGNSGVWSFGANDQTGGYRLLQNGAWAGNGAGMAMFKVSGTCQALNAQGAWVTWNGSAWTSIHPTTIGGLPTASAPSGSLVIGSDTWSFGAAVGANYQILKNGSPAGTGAAVAIFNVSGACFNMTAAGSWYKWDGTTWLSQSPSNIGSATLARPPSGTFTIP